MGSLRQSRGQTGHQIRPGNAVDKVLRVLEAATEPGGPHRLVDIAKASGVGKPSAHRILGDLVAARFLVNEGSGTYSAGPRLRAVAARVIETTTPGIEDVLADLQRNVGHTVHVGMLSGTRAIYTHKIDSNQPYQMASRVGMSLNLHSTAIGKCILAHIDPSEVEAIIASVGLPGRTHATITDSQQLMREIQRVRVDGFAVDDEENESTIRCLAAPVFDVDGLVLGALSVSTVTFTLSRHALEAHAPAVRKSAADLSQLLRGPLRT